MSYIVNLICVVQVIFLLAPDGRVTRDIVDHAIKVCKDRMKQVQISIKSFTEKRPLRTLKQDEVLKEIRALIARYSLSDQEVEVFRQEVASQSSVK
ncbi:hypothetical protein JVU11DRAFT_10080 [Chiua virens]|nr:hypothetical protein JVU11DRAFT_10080 [Chiua virens]